MMPPKYKVSPKADRTFDGITFDSKGEAKRYLELKLAEKGGLIQDLQLQYGFDVYINDQKYCTYTCDFSYIDTKSGKVIYEEVKSTGSVKDAAYRLRKKAAELYHGVKITEFLIGWNPKLTRKKKRVKKISSPDD